MPAILEARKRLIVRSGLSPQTAYQSDPAAPSSRQDVDNIPIPA